MRKLSMSILSLFIASVLLVYAYGENIHTQKIKSEKALITLLSSTISSAEGFDEIIQVTLPDIAFAPQSQLCSYARFYLSYAGDYTDDNICSILEHYTDDLNDLIVESFPTVGFISISFNWKLKSTNPDPIYAARYHCVNQGGVFKRDEGKGILYGTENTNNKQNTDKESTYAKNDIPEASGDAELKSGDENTYIITARRRSVVEYLDLYWQRLSAYEKATNINSDYIPLNYSIYKITDNTGMVDSSAGFMSIDLDDLSIMSIDITVYDLNASSEENQQNASRFIIALSALEFDGSNDYRIKSYADSAQKYGKLQGNDFAYNFFSNLANQPTSIQQAMEIYESYIQPKITAENINKVMNLGQTLLLYSGNYYDYYLWHNYSEHTYQDKDITISVLKIRAEEVK